ncbi:MAG TPA: type II toxin-antitoxin system YafQ family toxin [Rhizomicrobium sp.]
MRPIRLQKQFERDLKLAAKQGLALARLWAAVDLIRRSVRLDARHRPHKLSGEWNGFWECHIAPDWLLIWQDLGDEIVLVRTGTHSDLFR